MNASEKKSRRILITGGTSGLGLELAKNFLRLSFDVYITGRNLKDGLPVNNNFHFIKVDFSDLKEIVTVVHDLKKASITFDIVINNAGILSPPEFTLSDNSIEYTFQVNFLSHLLLDDLIIRNLSESDSITIVSTTSPVYKYAKPGFKVPDKENYNAFKAYSESKLYVLLTGEYLHLKYPSKNLTFIGYNPGTFSSGIFRMQKKWFKILYQIAAPFMRSAELVASRLTEILQQENIINGAIYSHRKSFSQTGIYNSDRHNEFLKVCDGMIIPFLND